MIDNIDEIDTVVSWWSATVSGLPNRGIKVKHPGEIFSYGHRPLNRPDLDWSRVDGELFNRCPLFTETCVEPLTVEYQHRIPILFLISQVRN
jgi:hypothetical protein